MREKLQTKYEKETAEAVVSRLVTEGYLNDRKFASHAAEYLHEVKKFGLYRIKQELMAKGIGKDVANEVCESFDFDEQDSIKSRILKKYKPYIGTPAGERKIQAALARYGFKYSDIAKVIREVREGG
jgi:SOS response regulatory protein OraA/RecX